MAFSLHLLEDSGSVRWFMALDTWVSIDQFVSRVSSGKPGARALNIIVAAPYFSRNHMLFINCKFFGLDSPEACYRLDYTCENCATIHLEHNYGGSSPPDCALKVALQHISDPHLKPPPPPPPPPPSVRGAEPWGRRALSARRWRAAKC